MIRVVLDSNGVDPFVDLPGAFKVVQQAVAAGRLELLSTQILRQEINAIPDSERMAKLSALLDLATDVPTGAFVVGVSAVGQARVSDDSDAFEYLRSNKIRHTHDALIASTSAYEGTALLTRDKRLRKRATALGIEVLDPTDVLAELGYPKDPSSVPDPCQIEGSSAGHGGEQQ